MSKITIENINENILLESTINTLGLFNKEIQRLNQDLIDQLVAKEKQCKAEAKAELKKQLAAKEKQCKAEADAELEKQLAEKEKQCKAEADAELEKQLAEKEKQCKAEADAELEKQLAEKEKQCKAEADVKLREYQSSFNDRLYQKIQKGISEIGGLLLEINGDSCLIDYCKKILCNEENSTNKDIAHYDEYKSIQDIIDSLQLSNSVLNQLSNLVWWSEQDIIQSQIHNVIPSIKKIAILFRSEVLAPLAIAGCTVVLPDSGFTDTPSKGYKNYNQEDKNFKNLFDVKLENYTLCSIFTVAYQLQDKQEEKIGKMFEYYTD